MEDFVKRLIKERVELVTKVNELRMFCGEENDLYEKYLLDKQEVIMTDYIGVLRLRIEYYGYEVK